MELWICSLVPNLSTPDNETCAKKLDLPTLYFPSSANEKKVGSVGEDVKKWTLNISSGSIDATAFLVKKIGNNSQTNRSFLSTLAMTLKNLEFPNGIALVPE